MLIEQEQYQEWLHNPVTKEVRKVMQERRDKIAHLLADGFALGSVEIYAESVGRCREIDDYLKMQYDDLKGV